MGIYQKSNTRNIIIDHQQNRINDSVIISGIDQSVAVDKGIFFLESIIPATGTTVTLNDGAGVEIVAGLGSFTSNFSPIRCDYGISIVGNVMIAKGYIVRGVFEE